MCERVRVRVRVRVHLRVRVRVRVRVCVLIRRPLGARKRESVTPSTPPRATCLHMYVRELKDDS